MGYGYSGVVRLSVVRATERRTLEMGGLNCPASTDAEAFPNKGLRP